MRGVTLLETIVALAIFGVLLGLSALALAPLRNPPGAAFLDSLERARATAIVSGTPERLGGVLFLPDGRVIGAPESTAHAH